ncbi:hypothetical protein GOODEAATRI_006666 [Goodea atripinnis]|uniref:Plexin cytoplasmic RasGAP domain-containing protein n=1 Tax=Goodea atripinnis TaxID=208336 RepID=A0ABV0PLF4_9TELE
MPNCLCMKSSLLLSLSWPTIVGEVLVQGEGPDVTPVKVLSCDTISQVKEKIIEQVYRNLPYSQRPKVDSVTLVIRNITCGVKSAVIPANELDEIKSKRGSIKDKSMTKAITEIYLTRLLSVKGTLQQFVDDFFRSVLCSVSVVPPAVKYFFDFLDEQALKHNNVDEETIHIWKTNSLPLRFWVNILKNPHFTFDVHVSEVVDASLSVIAQTFMDACTKSEHKLSRVYIMSILFVTVFVFRTPQATNYSMQRRSPPIRRCGYSTWDLWRFFLLRTFLSCLYRQRHYLHQGKKWAIQLCAILFFHFIIASLDEDPAAQSKQLTLRLQQIAAALENKMTDL